MLLNIFCACAKFKLIFISKNLEKKFNLIVPEANIKRIIFGSAYRNLKYKKIIKPKISFDAIYSGSLQKSKGIENFIKLSLMNKNKKFCIIGGNKLEIYKIKKNLKSKNTENLKFIQFSKPTILNYYLQNSKILVVPQIDETAESPMKLFEYLSLSKPILASRTNPISEILKNNINAVLYKTNNIYDMNLQFNRLLKNKSLRKNISKSSQIVSKKYTWEKRADKIFLEFKYF